MTDKINGGYIILARRLIESEIWRKPPAYLKIWIYILFQVNFKNTKNFPRGTGFFNFRQEKIPGVTLNQVYEFLRWAKTLNPTDLTTQITTQKTTRGIVLKVNNYDKYQDIENYVHQHRYQHKNQQTTNTITVKNERKRDINKLISLSSNERDLLKNYILSKSRKEPIYDFDAYLSVLIKNKTIFSKLEQAKKWQEKQEQKKLKVIEPPPTKEEQSSPEDTKRGLELLKNTVAEIKRRRTT